MLRGIRSRGRRRPLKRPSIPPRDAGGRPPRPTGRRRRSRYGTNPTDRMSRRVRPRGRRRMKKRGCP
tara:strand:- start:46 stop:246 length:201 start_codon:yes stop_codon:yes gene_type:complete